MKNALLLLIVIIQVSNTPAQEIESTVSNSSQQLSITWLYPTPQDTTIEHKNIRVQIGYTSKYEVNDLSLLLNGLPLTTEKRGVGFTKKSHPAFDELIERNVLLHKGMNKIVIAIRDSVGNVLTSEKSIFVTELDESIKLERNDFALLFATNEYMEWDDLSNPINDARTIAKELEANYGFEVEVLENFTQEEVLLKLREYSAKSYRSLDQLLIFFAGHGVYDELFGQGYLVCSDSKRNDPGKTSYISHTVLRQAINSIYSYHNLLLMDVCFGGTFDPRLGRSGSRGNNDLYNEIGNNAFIRRKLKARTRKYITSGGKEYVPDGRPGMHSPFVSKIMEGLNSHGGRDNIMTLYELYGWLERINPEPRVGDFGDDQPGSDFLFIYNPKN